MGVLVGSLLKKKNMVFILVSILLLFSATAMAQKVHHLKWEVEYTWWSPDGPESVVMTINGQFPGPTIRARAGDTIHLELTNKLNTEGVVIHWHGIRQNGTPWADGTASISQCAINPGETFLYRFIVDRAGTYFYHGHYGMQRSAGLYGLLIVDVAEGEKEKLEYEGEFDILLSDWWHKSSRDQEVDLSSKPMRWIGEPQTLLINGRGQFNCSLAAQFSNSTAAPCNITGGEQYAPYILKVHPNKTYRLRIASSTALASLNLAIGESYDDSGGSRRQLRGAVHRGKHRHLLRRELLRPLHHRPRPHPQLLDPRRRKPHTPPALTLLNYLPTKASQPPHFPPPSPPRWDDFNYSKAFSNKILAAAGSPRPPATHDRRITLLNTQNEIDGHTKWALNNISLSLPPTPYLGAIKYNITAAFDQSSPPDSYPADYDIMVPPPNPNTTSGNGVYTLALNSTVDVILQNANTLTEGVSEIHTWHLHGHDFWVLGYGEGKFEEGDVARLNLVNPPLRNTAVIFPFGWTALRFVADNPGAWPFHCHIESSLPKGSIVSPRFPTMGSPAD